MEARTCRSGRTGSPPRGETFGYARGLEEGERLRGEMREPLGGEKSIRRNAQRGVMVEAPPAPPFEVIQPQLVLQLLVVPLDPPAQHGEPDQIGARGRLRQRGQPILDRGGFGARPLDEQPLFGARRRPPVVAMRGPHADDREARTHRASGALAPRDGTPRPCWQLLGQCPYAEGAMSSGGLAPTPPANTAGRPPGRHRPLSVRALAQQLPARAW